jgi:hypothetical protein
MNPQSPRTPEKLGRWAISEAKTASVSRTAVVDVTLLEVPKLIPFVSLLDPPMLDELPDEPPEGPPLEFRPEDQFSPKVLELFEPEDTPDILEKFVSLTSDFPMVRDAHSADSPPSFKNNLCWHVAVTSWATCSPNEFFNPG